MIIYPASFPAAALAAGEPLTHPRILWQNLARDLLASAISASSETDAGPRDAPARPDTVEFWEPVALPATWQIDLGADHDVNAIGIAAHTLGTSGVTVEVSAGLATDIDTDENLPAFSEATVPSDDSPILFLDELRSIRHVKITLDADNSNSLPPRIAVIYIGEALTMQRPIYGGHTPITLSRQTELHQALSRGGQFLGQSFRRHGLVGAVAFRNLTAAWIRSDLDLFVQSARRYPYFFGWRPQTFPAELAYVWTQEDIHPSNMGIKDLMSVSWNMTGIDNG